MLTKQLWNLQLHSLQLHCHEEILAHMMLYVREQNNHCIIVISSMVDNEQCDPVLSVFNSIAINYNVVNDHNYQKSFPTIQTTGLYFCDFMLLHPSPRVDGSYKLWNTYPE